MTEKPQWKERFPVAWTEDAYVTRREFTRTLGLVSLATFATTGALAVVSHLRRNKKKVVPQARRLGAAKDLGVGESQVFYYPTEHDPCLLIRRGEDDYVAFAQKCTHLGCPVVYRRQDPKRSRHGTADTLYCPCHEGFFDATEGQPLAGPPRRSLKRVLLERRGPDWWATGVTA